MSSYAWLVIGKRDRVDQFLRQEKRKHQKNDGYASVQLNLNCPTGKVQVWPWQKVVKVRVSEVATPRRKKSR